MSLHRFPLQPKRKRGDWTVTSPQEQTAPRARIEGFSVPPRDNPSERNHAYLALNNSMAHEIPGKPIQTILLVDDHDMVVRALHNYLEKRGYNVLEAHDGEEALLLAECFPAMIHVLVTDLVMAKMNGRD